MNLSAQSMEIIGWRGAVHHLHIAILHLPADSRIHSWENIRVIVTELQESFQTSTTMFGASTIIAMRKQHHQSSALKPFLLTTGDELINDALRIVGEITKLSFPQDEAVGVDNAVAKIKTEGSEFRQRTVANGEASLIAADVVQWSVLIFVLLVVENGVAVTESSTLNVLK